MGFSKDEGTDDKPLPDFAHLLGQHKRPKFMLFTKQEDIDRLIRMYIKECRDETRKASETR